MDGVGISRFPSAGTAFDFSFITNNASTSNATIYTFSAQSLGTADSTRQIIISASGFQTTAQTIDSITVQGISGREVVTNIGSNARASIWIFAVPTGTTGDVVVTFSAGMLRCGIGVYRMVGGNATETAAPSDNTVTSNAFSADLTIPSGGAGLGYVIGDGSTRTWTWTNMGGTDDFDVTLEASGGTSHSGSFTTSSGTATRTATASGTFAGGTMLLAAWGP